MWLVVSGGLMMRLVAAWWQLARLRRQAVRADADATATCHEIAARLDLPAPELLRSAYLPSPCLAGIRQPVVLLTEIDSGESIRDVLVHELAHLKRRDCHWNLLRQMATALLFFQPLLWRLSHRLETTAEEVCDAANITPDEHAQLLAAGQLSYATFSLDDPVSDGNNGTTRQIDLLADVEAEDPESTFMMETLKTRLVTILKDLPERERLILALYYYENLTLVEIGQVLNISESRVSQIMSKSLDQLRTKLK
ncbi:MAG: sigma-70 family RNA polymerase sigma factor [Candidatus Marinimicrobia bacterium]|nr:sigma-70 family RNA polymerase sigma factor [Candidatus Neomarinimicrobiota bacterium]